MNSTYTSVPTAINQLTGRSDYQLFCEKLENVFLLHGVHGSLSGTSVAERLTSHAIKLYHSLMKEEDSAKRKTKLEQKAVALQTEECKALALLRQSISNKILLKMRSMKQKPQVDPNAEFLSMLSKVHDGTEDDMKAFIESYGDIQLTTSGFVDEDKMEGERAMGARISLSSAADRRKSMADILASASAKGKKEMTHALFKDMIADVMLSMIEMDLPQISTLQTWEQLRKLYGTTPTKTKRHQGDLYKIMFMSLKMKEGEDPEEYAEDVENMATEINETGVITISAGDVVSRIINGLSSSMQNAHDYTALSHSLSERYEDEDDADVDDVVDMIKIERAKRVKCGIVFVKRERQLFDEKGTTSNILTGEQEHRQDNPIAMIAERLTAIEEKLKSTSSKDTGGDHHQRSSSTRPSDSNSSCFNCGKKGHSVRDCRLAKDEDKIEKTKSAYLSAKKARYEQRQQYGKADEKKTSTASANAVTKDDEEEQTASTTGVVKSAFALVITRNVSQNSDCYDSHDISCLDAACTLPISAGQDDVYGPNAEIQNNISAKTASNFLHNFSNNDFRADLTAYSDSTMKTESIQVGADAVSQRDQEICDFSSSSSFPPIDHAPHSALMVTTTKVNPTSLTPITSILKVRIDTGASAHCVNNIEAFPNKDQYKPFGEKDDVTLTVANGERLKCAGEGTAYIKLSNDRILSLANCLHCPGLNNMLMSVAQATKKGIIFVFDDKRCQALTSDDGTIVFDADLGSDLLYSLKASYVSSSDRK